MLFPVRLYCNNYTISYATPPPAHVARLRFGQSKSVPSRHLCPCRTRECTCDLDSSQLRGGQLAEWRPELHCYYLAARHRAARRLSMKKPRYRAVELSLPKAVIKEYGLLKALWGTDIFVLGIPLIKAMISANILVWFILWLTQ